MEDWGEIYISKCTEGSDFWYLYNELCDDESGFLHNRSIIVEAFKNESLYSLRVGETDSMYERGAIRDEIFCKNSWYLLPCFCIKEENNAIIIWVHSRARRLGFGTKLVKLLNIEYAIEPLPTTIKFWEACDIKTISRKEMFEKSKKKD